MPLDLAGRFARRGRVIRVDTEARLKVLFGVGEVDIEAKKSALAPWLLRPSANKRLSVREGRLTHDLLWTVWLRTELGLDTEGGMALDALLAWAALDLRSKAFLDGAGALPGVREECLTWLGRSLGPAGPLAWLAWEQGKGARLLQYAILFEALTTSPSDAVRMWIKQRLKMDLGLKDEVALAAVPNALGTAAGAALRYIERKAGAAEVRAAVRGAEDLVDDSEIRAALEPSTRLPSSLTARLTALGQALLEGAKQPSVEAVRLAERRLQSVDGHSLAAEAGSERHLERAWMAVRLLAWLSTHPTHLPMGTSPHDAVETLGTWYTQEGGYVDWARRAARGTTDTVFGQGVQAVVRAADELRRSMDRTFARALTEWVATGQPAHAVLPIDRALERVAGRFLEEAPDRRLLILLLDGMAWAQAVELFDSLSQRGWGQLAWHGTKKGRIGSGLVPVVLAAVPSITEVSRTAFFASRQATPGKVEDTQKDRERFRDNKVMHKFFPGTSAPTLLLRAESQTKGGAATEEALRLVEDTDQRVVAVVLNSIDDSLKGNPATRHPWGVDNIASLADLLEKARACGRAVLFAADHGHVPADLLESKGGISGGARWRPLPSEKTAIEDFEVKFPAGRAWAPKGAWGVALMVDDTVRWGGSGHAGEHGGASLAEIVAPCVLAGAEDLQGPGGDEALAIRPLYVPTFWHLSVKSTEAVATPPATPQKPPKTNPNQLTLLPLAEPTKTPSKRPTLPPPKAPVPSAAATAFSKSKVLEARAPDAARRKEVVSAVDFLLEKAGSASGAAFGARMELLPRRVPGFVAKLQETLNVDGYEVVRFDSVSQQVTLDSAKLKLLFEVAE
ncbi:MAG: BREX-2 system phosphatase PglZ [Polyangiaceae bacterium]|nr:BREX-2 system phosphatase PglZ [Polyangiaceae bacterium]